MKIISAVAYRISKLLKERNLSQYRLEKITLIPHNTMKSIMGERNESLNLKTIMQITKGLEITVSEFFNDPIFENENLDID